MFLAREDFQACLGHQESLDLEVCLVMYLLLLVPLASLEKREMLDKL